MKTYYEQIKLLEYITNDVIAFRDYIKMTDDERKKGLSSDYPFTLDAFLMYYKHTPGTEHQLSKHDDEVIKKLKTGDLSDYEEVKID